MDPRIRDTVEELNAAEVSTRLRAAEEIGELVRSGGLEREETEEVNNHVHTVYSFSPYAPSMAAYRSWEAGLKAVGIMDHDSVGGGEEMLTSCAAVGMGSTVGFELRVNFSGTALEGRKLNSPDSTNIGYIAIHGIPRQSIDRCDEFLGPLQAARNERNRRMVDTLNTIITGHGLPPLRFEEDVKGISKADEGGSITERHILFALGNLLIATYGKGKPLMEFLEGTFKLDLSGRIREFLSDPANPHYPYDLLGALKSSFIDKIFLQPNEEECINVVEAVDFANSVGAIPAYAYLGDVAESPTGDKKAEKFEDSFLDELFPVIRDLGFKAVTYMPPRNTREQLERIQSMCGDFGFMEISGVDINSSRQSFNCPIILEPEFRHLADATWALIAHEKLASCDERYGLFRKDNPLSTLSLAERIDRYNEVGRGMDQFRPDSCTEVFDDVIKESR
jgi:predicted metal-dependent phosphoesterase TrpH